MSWLADLFVVAGVAMLGYGLWQIYEPAMWIVVGMLIGLYGLALARRVRRRQG